MLGAYETDGAREFPVLTVNFFVADKPAVRIDI
jgi:hypothetical protein